MNKILLLLNKIYSFSNYKTNLYFFYKNIKNNIYKDINYLYYIINNLNYINKKNISKILYLIICNKKSKNIRKFKNFYLLSNENIYFIKINNYCLYSKFFIYYLIRIKVLLKLKIIKKIYTNLLYKYKKEIYENLKEKILNILLYIYIDNVEKIKIILKLNLNYIDKNLFYFIKNIKKICLLLFSNKESYSNKIYLGMINNQNNNNNYYLNFLIKNLIKKNIFKINVSLEIYNFDLINIIKNLKIFKKVKINLIIGIPDLFLEYLIKNKKWFLFDSNNVKKEYEFFIQSYYDEYIGYGSFREMYKKVIKNNKIIKICIDSKKIILKILKNNIKIVFTDKLNRNNINKHISTLIPSSFHNKIFDRNNYFKNKIYYIKNANIIIKRNNNCYLEIILDQKFNLCKNNIKNFFFKFKFMDNKNDFLIFQREINFHFNFRIKPILFKLKNIKKNSKQYIFYNLLKINSYMSKYSDPYLWFPGSDIYNNKYFYKNKFNTKKWKKVIFFIKKNKLKCSLDIIYKNNKKTLISFDNYFIKLSIIIWQTK
ncbi:MAG: hypothetical protein ACSLEI_00065 [Candidatus Carsonella ruddii]